MRVFAIALLFVSVCNICMGQSWLFAKRQADSLTYRELKTDRLDNIIAYSFTRSLTSTTAITELVKYDKFGNLLWKNNIYCGIYSYQFTSFSGILSHTVDKSGNIYIACTNILKINDSVFNGSTSTMAIAKFDPNGHILWIRNATAAASSFGDIICDSTNNLFFVMQCQSSNVVIADSSYTFPSSPVNNRLFICRMDSAGKVKWVRTFFSKAVYTGSGSTFNDFSCHTSINNKRDILISGTFYDTLYAMGTMLTASTLSNGTRRSAFAASLNENGILKYAIKKDLQTSTDNMYLNGLFDDGRALVIMGVVDTTLQISPTSSVPVYKDSLYFIDTTGMIYRETSTKLSSVNRFEILKTPQITAGGDILFPGRLSTANPLTYPPTYYFEVRKYDSTGVLKWEKGLPPVNNFKSAAALYVTQGSDRTFIIGNVSTTGNGTLHANNDTININNTTVTFFGGIKEGANLISGRVYYDLNGNSQFDAGDVPAAYQVLRTNSQNPIITDDSGYYRRYAAQGIFNDTVIINPPYYTASPSTFSYTFSGTDSTISQQDIRFAAIPNIKDLYVKLTPTTNASYSSNSQIRILYKNIGTTVQAPTVTLKLSSLGSYISSSQTPSFISTDSITWNINNLSAGEWGYIDVNIQYAFGPLNSPVKTRAGIIPIVNDSTPGNNRDTLFQLLKGSFDPNDKLSNPIDTLNRALVTSGQAYIDYTINFQNTGTDTARQVRIVDDLSPLFNLSTLEILDATHFVIPGIVDKRIEFLFPAINLPDSGHNKLTSRGAVHFRIKPYSTLPVGDTIKNTASIYFDFNDPINTNTTTNYIVSTVFPLRVLELSGIHYEQFNSLSWTTSGEENEKYVVEKSTDGNFFSAIGSVNATAVTSMIYHFTDNKLSSTENYYRIKIIGSNGSISYSKILLLKSKASQFVVFPNPISNIMYVQITSANEDETNICITDISGKQLLNKRIALHPGVNSVSFNVASLAPGVYLFVSDGINKETRTFIKL